MTRSFLMKTREAFVERSEPTSQDTRQLTDKDLELAALYFDQGDKQKKKDILAAIVSTDATKEKHYLKKVASNSSKDQFTKSNGIWYSHILGGYVIGGHVLGCRPIMEPLINELKKQKSQIHSLEDTLKWPSVDPDKSSTEKHFRLTQDKSQLISTGERRSVFKKLIQRHEKESQQNDFLSQKRRASTSNISSSASMSFVNDPNYRSLSSTTPRSNSVGSINYAPNKQSGLNRKQASSFLAPQKGGGIEKSIHKIISHPSDLPRGFKKEKKVKMLDFDKVAQSECVAQLKNPQRSSGTNSIKSATAKNEPIQKDSAKGSTVPASPSKTTTANIDNTVRLASFSNKRKACLGLGRLVITPNLQYAKRSAGRIMVPRLSSESPPTPPISPTFPVKSAKIQRTEKLVYF